MKFLFKLGASHGFTAPGRSTLFAVLMGLKADCAHVLVSMANSQMADWGTLAM
jgi:hypothetical protein